MARIEVHSDRVVIALSNAEKLLAMRRKDITIERSMIRSALITEDPWIWIRGVPSPGTHLAGRVACGVWRALGGEDFLLVRGKNKAVVIDIDTAAGADSQAAAGTQASLETDMQSETEFSHFARVIISTAHAAELITALKLDQASGKNAKPKVHSTAAKARAKK